MVRLCRIVCLLALMSVCAACGQKGPLVLPDETQQQSEEDKVN